MHKSTDILSLASGLRCKPGDLAIVTGKNVFKENVGCIVEVVSVKHISDRLGFLWNIRSMGRPLKMHDPDTGKSWFTEFAASPDAALTPINGIPVKDAENASIDQENTIPEEVH